MQISVPTPGQLSAERPRASRDAARWPHDHLPTPPAPMTRHRLRTGRLAEARAAEHLASLDYAILARNARTRYGELDLVAFDAAAPWSSSR